MSNGLAAVSCISKFSYFALFVAFAASCAPAQQAAVLLPDAPGTTVASSSSSSVDSAPTQEQKPQDTTQTAPGGPTNLPAPSGERVQSKGGFGLMPNFVTVSADMRLPAQSVKDKFKMATEASFGYSAIAISSVVALESWGRNSVPEFGTDGVGYGRYLWHEALDRTQENYLVLFIVPTITHEDTRYYTLGRGGFLKRTGYSLSRIVVTRSDAGNETFNFSEVVGTGASAALSNAYYPGSQRTVSQTGQNWALDLGVDAATFMFREFWPDIRHSLSPHHGH